MASRSELQSLNRNNGLPSVFNVSKNPWIEVNGASATEVAEQVKRCPSSALTYELLKKAD